MSVRNLRFAILLLFVITAMAAAAVVYDRDSVVIPDEPMVPENVILTGESVNVYGEVDGDVIAACKNYNQYGFVHDNIFAACRFADISGNANDLLVFAQTVNIKSDTTGDVRGAAQTFNIYGYVDGDVMVGAESVFIGPGAVVTGDVYIGASSATILGDVLGDVKGGMEFVNIGGTVHGDVEVWANEILFTGSGEVLGDLDYHREKELEIDFARNVRGRISFIPDLDDGDVDESPFTGFGFGFFLLLTAMVTTFLLLWIWRRGVEGSLTAMEQKTGHSIVSGLLGMIVLPFVAVLLLVLIITLPVGLMLLFLYPVLLYIGWIMFGIWLGKTLLDGLLKRDVSIWLAAPVGVLVAGILGYVPFVGFFIAIVATLLGMGMFIVHLLGLRTLRT